MGGTSRWMGCSRGPRPTWPSAVCPGRWQTAHGLLSGAAFIVLRLMASFAFVGALTSNRRGRRSSGTGLQGPSSVCPSQCVPARQARPDGIPEPIRGEVDANKRSGAAEELRLQTPLVAAGIVWLLECAREQATVGRQAADARYRGVPTPTVWERCHGLAHAHRPIVKGYDPCVAAARRAASRPRQRKARGAGVLWRSPRR